MSRRSLILGIEGGSAQSVALAADDAGNILAQREGGSTNVATAGIDAVARVLYQLVSLSCDDMRCRPDEMAAVVIGMTGVAREHDRRRVVEALEGQFSKAGLRAPRFSVESHARITLEGAFDGGPGVVVIADRHSFVTCKTPKGDVLSAGGWGQLLGDEGSAYFIGREALAAVVNELDGLGPSGKLRQVLAEKFGLDTRERIITQVYQEKLDLARLAPTALEIATQNDVISQRIVQRAAGLLADQIRSVVMKIGIARKVGLIMRGAFVEENPIYANVLQMKIIKLLPQVDVRQPARPPAHGAVLMALGMLKST